MSAEFRGKNAKSPLQTSAMAHWRGRKDAVGVKFTSFCRTRYVHPEKNIFEFFVAHTMCPFFRTVFAVELEWLEAHPTVSQISRNSGKSKKDAQTT